MGWLKLCKAAGTGVQKGKVFSFKVNNANYNVLAGTCIVVGQFPFNTQVTVQENIPAGYYVSDMDIRPISAKISEDKVHGLAVARISSGMTTVIFKNSAINTATATPSQTQTPKPPTPTPSPMGRLQICKAAIGGGVSGIFKFTFGATSESVPVGACSQVDSVNAGKLTITENARPGYVVSNIFTIPAGRLISKNLNGRSATVMIVPGGSTSKTIVVFVNRAVRSQSVTNTAASAQTTDLQSNDNPLDAFLQFLSDAARGWLEPAHASQ